MFQNYFGHLNCQCFHNEVTKNCVTKNILSQHFITPYKYIADASDPKTKSTDITKRSHKQTKVILLLNQSYIILKSTKCTTDCLNVFLMKQEASLIRR